MSIPTLASDSIDHLLGRAVEELALRFTGLFNIKTIDRYVHKSYQSLYRTATIKTYLPNLAARFATDRLTALAQATGRLDKTVPEVLLVCVHNAGRSQMAAALLDRAANGRIHVRSAGSLPAGEVNPAVIDRRVHRLVDELVPVA